MLRSGRFTAGKEKLYPFRGMWVGPTAMLMGVKKSRPHRETIRGLSSSIDSLTDFAISGNVQWQHFVIIIMLCY
jgi:hypothetical protein